MPFNAIWVNVLIGLLRSDVLSTLPKPTLLLVSPVIVPKKFGLIIFPYTVKFVGAVLLPTVRLPPITESPSIDTPPK